LGAVDSWLKDTDEVSWGLFPPRDKELKRERKVGLRARDVSAHTNVQGVCFFSFPSISVWRRYSIYTYGVGKKIMTRI